MNDEEFRRACELDAARIRSEFKRMKRVRWYEYVLYSLILAYGIYLSPWVQQ